MAWKGFQASLEGRWGLLGAKGCPKAFPCHVPVPFYIIYITVLMHEQNSSMDTQYVSGVYKKFPWLVIPPVTCNDCILLRNTLCSLTVEYEMERELTFMFKCMHQVSINLWLLRLSLAMFVSPLRSTHFTVQVIMKSRIPEHMCSRLKYVLVFLALEF